MSLKEREPEWRAMSLEVIVGMQEWRTQHPKATLREIEQALDERLQRLRARMLQDTALASAAREWEAGSEAVRCPHCGGEMEGRGKKERHLQTHGGEEVRLEREYGVCPVCGTGFFPPG